MRRWITALGAVAALGCAPAALAQFPGSSNGEASSGSPLQSSPRVENNQVVTYSDVEYGVVRVLKDTYTNGYRVILKVTEKQEPRRSAAFIQPVATFMDDMGNVYEASDSTGIRICDRRGWGWLNQSDCLRHEKGDLNQMITDKPMPVAVAFTPVDGKVIPELADQASTATLNARMMIVPKDGNPENVDIIIPDIALP